MILPIKTEYLLAIASGDKAIEYRDTTDYYISRFCHLDSNGEFMDWKPIREITFRAGYSKSSFSVTVPVASIELVELVGENGEGTGEFMFAIHIGDIAKTINYKQGSTAN